MTYDQMQERYGEAMKASIPYELRASRPANPGSKTNAGAVKPETLHLAKKAQRLRAAGFNNTETAKMLGVSQTYALKLGKMKL